ncbi:Rossmann-like and DUF2520 domain-containing protein [Lutibacter sp.]|uniref:Rossmann-like and DUF2520 domain-containing protein n=1 Tax=Lutibacter sp. TaxID=1925666 RepID=UPI0027336E00|nr:Rossmann-like and DUF2520 domain-containing protein [Lutibacter sp.]MDP3312881.1 DUF2520 domain-containing protein [Lutibacter sp.]
MIKVVIIGGGNVAFHLTNQLLKSNVVSIVQVYNRSIEKINYLKSKTSITNNLNQLLKAEVYIIAVSDNSISEVSSNIKNPNSLVVHTSGSVSLKDLTNLSRKGVFYPIQTFSKEKKVNFSKIPICIEATNEKDTLLLEIIAKSISNYCIRINEEQRKNIHVAAVFVNNFVNHLYHIGNEICTKNNISFEILKPLIIETASKINTLTPFEAQTGPAIRNDTKTIEKHTVLLNKNQQEIYTLLTNSILQFHGKKL